jgi:CHAT domain-containing protein
MILRKLFVSLLAGYSIFAISFGQEPADSARYYFNEYLQVISLGDFERSELLLEKILDGNYKLPVYNLALVHNALGYVYYERGRLINAQEQYRIAEELVSESDPIALSLRVSIYNNQAIYYKGLGDYTNALEYNNQALRLLNSIRDWDDVSYSKLSALLLNKGITLYHLDRYEESLEVLIECEKIKKALNHSYLGSVYFNLARDYRSLGETDLTCQYYIKSIDQWISEYDSSYYELANIYLHYGQYLTEQGQSEQGFEYLQKALQNYRQNYGDVHPLTAECYEYLARYRLDQAESEKALDYLQLALQAVSVDFQGGDPFTNPAIETSSYPLTLLKVLATKTKALESVAGCRTTADEKMAYLQGAISTNLLSIDVLRKVQSSFLSGESRIYLNSKQKDLFTTGISLNLEMFRISGIEHYKEEAFLMAAKGKSNELIHEMDQQEWLYLESLTDTYALTAIELKQQIGQLSNMIQVETMDMNPDSALLSGLQEQLFHSQDSFNRQMDELRRIFPQIGHFESTGLNFSMEQIRRNLKRNETLVEYFMTGTESAEKEQLYIFVVSRSDCQYYHAPVDSALHLHLETIMRNLHEFDPYKETGERFDSLKVALFGVYSEIVHPVESWLGGRNLVIVPDEILSYIPFDALITHLDRDSITNYAGVHYLLHDYYISYLYNSQLLKRKPFRGWRLPGVKTWIPEYASAPESSRGKLKGATEEVQSILKVVRGSSIQGSPDKQEIISLLEEPSILHLAMHSLVTDNADISPYFVLDSVADPTLSNRLHDYEINALNLCTPMVVLSSCETAGGQLLKGEGIMSLSRSFLQAGAASVVHSLWPVEDVKSREIMVGFYGELNRGHSKRNALSIVKRGYLDQQPPFYTHPYYWAAFQITGDPSPLCCKRRVATIPGSILIALLVFYFLRRRSFLRRVRASSL